MSEHDFISAIRAAQKSGKKQVSVTLAAPHKRCRYLTALIAGQQNGNPHDIWLLRRAYLGSARLDRDLEGWPARVAAIA